MSRSVPLIPPLPSPADVRSGVPVRGPTWRKAGEAANWLLGRGAQVIPGYSPASVIPASGTRTFRFMIAGREQARARIWFLHLRKAVLTTAQAAAPSGRVIVTIGATSVDLYANVSRSQAAYQVSEPIASPTPGEVEVVISMQNTDPNYSVTVDWIQCVEVPRFELDTAGDGGVDIGSVQVSSPIADASNVSVGGVADATLLAETVARRNTLIAWSVDTADAVGATSATPSNVFPLPLPLLPRRKTTATDRIVKVFAYARSIGGASTQITVSSAVAGDSEGIPAPSTSWGWVSGELTVRTEDLTTADGWPGGSVETVNVTLASLTGIGTAQIAALVVLETS